MKSQQKKKQKLVDYSSEKSNFKLRFYSGYKKRETPRAVIIGNKEFTIEEIIWRKRVLDHETGKTFEVFMCKMEGETVKITIYESGEWAISFCGEQ
jgi:hypothetical protein